MYPHATCEEACGLTRSAPSGSSSAPSIGSSFMQGFSNGLMNGMAQGIQNGMSAEPQQKTPQELESERQEALREAQARQAAAMALEQKRQQKIARLDSEAFEQMSLLGPPFNPQKKPSSDFLGTIACGAGAESEAQFVCHVTVCGGSTGHDICCPAGYPKLNECDCKCYPANADFECMQYAGCNYSTPGRAQ